MKFSSNKTPKYKKRHTSYYFLHFLLILPILGKIEKTTPLPLSITSPVLGGSADLAMAKNTDVRKEKL